MFTTILKNKIFRVCVILIVITFPFALKYRFVKTVGSSMRPTFNDGEWAVIERRSSLGKDWLPRRFDKVIITDKKENLHKRIIGLPGDTVEIKEGLIYLNEKKLKDFVGGIVSNTNQKKKKIPEGYVWVIGDNREDSWFGALSIKNIIGKILF